MTRPRPPFPLHLRMERSHTALAPHLFADLYRFGQPKSGVPLVCYWDGAIPSQEYERRRQETPDLLAGIFGEVVGTSSVDLLVLSVPEVEPCTRSTLRANLRQTFLIDLLSLGPNPEPVRLAYVGYSVGAYLALSLALDVPRSRSVATIGGVDMATAVADTADPRLDSISIATFVNYQDECIDETTAFRDLLSANHASLVLRYSRGRHDLDDYIANGAVRESFSFVLSRL